MPELRKNIATNEWVIISAERAKRPDEILEKRATTEQLPPYKENCPFCLGNENKTPPELFRVGTKDKWEIRVIPNKFPALSGDQPPILTNDGVIQRMDGVGIHEIIVETPFHNLCIPFMKDEEIENLLNVYKQRYLESEKKEYIKHIIIFKNYGLSGGTSLEHPHSQLIALPVVPIIVSYRIQAALNYYHNSYKCVFCTMIDEEIRRKERIVIESEHFLTFIPYAAYSPFHTWIFPKKHSISFGEIHPDELKDLAKALKTYLLKIYKGLNNPSYNLVIRSMPCKGIKIEKRETAEFHWYIAVVLRLTSTAGFEMGSGMFINVSLPENDAAYLRNISI